VKRAGRVYRRQCFSSVAFLSGCAGAWMPKWLCPFGVIPAVVEDSTYSGLAVVGRAMGVSQFNSTFLVMYVSVWKSVFLSMEWTFLCRSHVAECKHSAIYFIQWNEEHFVVCPSSQFCSNLYLIHLRIGENLSEDPLGWGVGVRSGL